MSGGGALGSTAPAGGIPGGGISRGGGMSGDDVPVGGMSGDGVSGGGGMPGDGMPRSDMPDGDAGDTRFSLPDVDASAMTEAGVILLGQQAGHLLAGLGVTTLADDPASVSLLVDQVRHTGSAVLALDQLIGLGAHRWNAQRHLPSPVADAALPVRQAWERAYAIVSGRAPAAGNQAQAAYLTACWLRRAEIDRHASRV